MMIETNGLIRVNTNTQSATNPVLTLQDNGDSVLTCTSSNLATSCQTNSSNVIAGNELDAGSVPVTITEQGPNSGIFGSYDESDTSALKIASNAARGTSATVDYNEVPVTILVGNSFATIDIQPTDDEWNSGEEIPVTLVDGDANKNSRADEDLDLFANSTALIPSLRTGDPFTLGDSASSSRSAMFTNASGGLPNTASNIGSVATSFTLGVNNRTSINFSVDAFSQRGIFFNNTADTTTNTVYNALLIDLDTTIDELKKSIGDSRSTATTRLHEFNFLNLDLSSINASAGRVDVYLVNGTFTPTTVAASGTTGVNATLLVNDVNARSLTSLNSTALNTVLFDEQTAGTAIGLLIVTNSSFTEDACRRMKENVVSSNINMTTY
jgi:hypothetical protein